MSFNFSRHFKTSLTLLSVLLVLGGIAVPTLQSKVTADTFTDQINSLNAANAESRQIIANLATQASTYQQAIDSLQATINQVQSQINENQAKQAELIKQIAIAQAEIDRQRAILAEDVKAMYVDGTPSDFEVFASSNNLSEFVDKQEYRSRVQNQLQETMKKIAVLQKQLQEQKAQVEQLISEQKAQQAQLDTDRAKQQELLNYNESQQNDYLAQINANNTRLAEVQAAQRAALAAVIGTRGSTTSPTGSSIRYKNYTGGSYCGGGYRYCWAGFDQYLTETLNKWGLEWARECVHYAADRLERDGKYVPNMGGSGNANQWINHGTLVSTPQRGDVVYMPLPGVGHVGIVEGVNSDGTVHVSQMNFPYGGYYSELDLYITPGVQFLRF